ncbi:hypothetical protein RRG08_013257, partial [Elysia crispata]
SLVHALQPTVNLESLRLYIIVWSKVTRARPAADSELGTATSVDHRLVKSHSSTPCSRQ